MGKRTVETTEPAHVPGIGPCLEWQGARLRGYGRVRRAGRMQYAHRVAWEEVNGPIPDGLLVLHRCDNPPCVRPEHLFLGTDADNARDKAEKGRGNSPRGDAHGSKTKPESRARGNANGSRLHPERLARGDAHGSRLHPERRARGDRNGSRLHPESRPRGDRSGARTKPERRPRGDANGRAKLTEEKVRKIRSRHAVGESQTALGRTFGVNQVTIGRIVRLETWQHVGGRP